MCQPHPGLHCKAWGNTVGYTITQCSGNMTKQLWGMKHATHGCCHPMVYPTPPWRAPFPVCITAPPSCSTYLTYTLLSQGVWSHATRHQRENSLPAHGVHRDCATAQLRSMRHTSSRALWQSLERTPKQQCAPTSAMAGLGAPWRWQCSVVTHTTPPRRRPGVQ